MFTHCIKIKPETDDKVNKAVFMDEIINILFYKVPKMPVGYGIIIFMYWPPIDYTLWLANFLLSITRTNLHHFLNLL